MRTVIVTTATIMCAVFTICIIVTLNSTAMRHQEIQDALYNTLPQTINAIYEGKQGTDEDLEDYIIQSIMIQMNTEVDLEIKVLSIDTVNGLVDVQVTSYYDWAGVKKSVTVRKTMVIETYMGQGQSNVSDYTAKFMVNGHLYRIVKGDAGSRITSPEEPTVEGTFNGWQEYKNGVYGPIITDTQWGDMVLNSDVVYIASIGGTLSNRPEGDTYIDINAAKTLNYYEGENVRFSQLSDDIKHLYQSPSSISSVEIENISYQTTSLGVKGDYTVNEIRNGSLYTYMGGLAKNEKVKELLTYKITRTNGETLEDNCDIIISYNGFPEITAPDRWFTLSEATSGKITENELLSTIIASDDENRNITSKTRVLGFMQYNEVGTYRITYYVVDDGKKGIARTALVHIVDSASEQSNYASYPRSISVDTYPLMNNNIYKYSNGNFMAIKYDNKLCFADKDKNVLKSINNKPYVVDAGFAVQILNNGDGTYRIIPLSKWYKDDAKITALKKTLSKSSLSTPKSCWYIPDRKIRGIKEQILLKGFIKDFKNNYAELLE